MGMTTVVLIILALSVRIMAWSDAYLRRREEAAKETAAIESADEPVAEPVCVDQGSSGAARVAAIAVAIALSRRNLENDVSVQSGVVANSANPNYDSWLAEGRARQRAKQGSRGWR